MLALILAAVVAGAARALCPDGTPPPCRGRRTPPGMSVAVLTFANLSPDTSDSYLADGLAEELTSRLGQVGRLTLASRTAVRRLRDVAQMPTDDIGRVLNVRYLLNGSVRRSGSRLRVAVELVRASGGDQVWSNQYDRSAADLLDIQQDVATQVATAVAGRLLPAERSTLTTRPTRSPDAYDAYLRGSQLYQAGIPAQQHEAAALLERATTLDSTFAEAWATLSLVNSQMFWFYVDRTPECLARARVAAERAIAIAPASARSHIALGYFYYWGSRDYGRALQEFSAALESRPNDPAVHSALANVARREGSWDRAVSDRARAIEMDPEGRSELTEHALTLHVLRRFGEAQAFYDRALEPPADYIFPYLFDAGMVLMRDGRTDRAGPLLDFIAAHAEDFAERTFHDPGAAMPVWRVAGPHQEAILASVPGASPGSRAMHYLVVGQVLGATRRLGAAAAYDSVVAIVTGQLASRPDDDGFHSQLSLAEAGLGRCDDALREGRRAVALLPVSADALSGPQRLQALAEVEATCQQPDSAIAHLAYLLSIPSFVTVPLLAADPVWQPLRSDARFARLAAEP